MNNIRYIFLAFLPVKIHLNKLCLHKANLTNSRNVSKNLLPQTQSTKSAFERQYWRQLWNIKDPVTKYHNLNIPALQRTTISNKLMSEIAKYIPWFRSTSDPLGDGGIRHKNAQG